MKYFYLSAALVLTVFWNAVLTPSAHAQDSYWCATAPSRSTGCGVKPAATECRSTAATACYAALDVGLCEGEASSATWPGNPTGQCSYNGPNNCQPGEEFDNATGSCIVPEPDCPQGTAYDGNECIPVAPDCPEGSDLFQQGGFSSCMANVPPETCMVTAGYLFGKPLCIEDAGACVEWTDGQGNNGVYGMVNGEYVCILPNYGNAIPDCDIGSVAVYDDGIGSAYACQSPTDTQTGENFGEDPVTGEPFCDPFAPHNVGTDNCPNQRGGTDFDREKPDNPFAKGGDGDAACEDDPFSSACYYEPCNAKGTSSAECAACIASPLSAACHAPCEPGAVSNGNSCVACSVDDTNPACSNAYASDGLKQEEAQTKALGDVNDELNAQTGLLGEIRDSLTGTSEMPGIQAVDQPGEAAQVWADLQGVPIVAAAGNFAASFTGSTECPAPTFTVFGEAMALDYHCTAYAEMGPTISAVMLAVWALLGFRVVMSS